MVQIACQALTLCALAICAYTDIRSFRIPNAVTLPAAGVLLVLLFVGDPMSALRQTLFAAVVLAVLWVFSRFSRDSFGLGDAKLMALMALSLSVLPWISAQITGLIFALAHRALIVFFKSRRARGGHSFSATWVGLRRVRIPLAPYLAVGYMIVAIAMWVFDSDFLKLP